MARWFWLERMRAAVGWRFSAEGYDFEARVLCRRVLRWTVHVRVDRAAPDLAAKGDVALEKGMVRVKGFKSLASALGIALPRLRPEIRERLDPLLEDLKERFKEDC